MESPVNAMAPRASRRILLVEDVVETRASMGALLRLVGYTVYEAASADEALAVLNSPLEVDCLVTDVQMEGSMDGLALARWVLRNHPGVRVVIASGLEADPGLRDADVAWFRKPYPPGSLIAHLQRMLEDA